MLGDNYDETRFGNDIMQRQNVSAPPAAPSPG